MMECDLLTVRRSGWPDALMWDVVRRDSSRFKVEGKTSSLKTHEDQAQPNRRPRTLKGNKRLVGSEVESNGRDAPTVRNRVGEQDSGESSVVQPPRMA